MEVRVDSSELFRGMQTVRLVVSRKPSVPVLGCVLLDADPEHGRLSITGTSFDSYVRVVVPARVHTGGRVAMEAHALGDLLKDWPRGDVALQSDGDGDVLRVESLPSADQVFKVWGCPADEFPCWPGESPDVEPNGSYAPLAVFDHPRFLTDMIDRVAFAAAGSDGSRPIFDRVFWRLSAKKVSMIATDGSFLCQYDRPVALSEMGDRECSLLPLGSGLQDLSRGLNGSSFGMSVSVLDETDWDTAKDTDTTGGWIRVVSGNVEWLLRSDSDTYVDFAQVVPSEDKYDRFLDISSDALRGLLRRLLRVSGKDGVIDCAMSEEGVNVSTDSVIRRHTRRVKSDREASESLSGIHQYRGEPFDVAFNGSIMQLILNSVVPKKADLRLSFGGYREFPIKIELLGVGSARGDTFFVLLMPVRIPSGGN